LLAGFKIHGWRFLLVENVEGNEYGHLEGEGTTNGEYVGDLWDYFLVVLH
jgi:hypothetical protein